MLILYNCIFLKSLVSLAQQKWRLCCIAHSWHFYFYSKLKCVLDMAFKTYFLFVDKKRMLNAEETDKSIIYQSPSQHRDHCAVNNLSGKASEERRHTHTRTHTRRTVVKTCWRGAQDAASRGVMHCSTAWELIIHRKSQYTLYNAPLCRWSFLIHLASCHLIAQRSWWLLLTIQVPSSPISLSQSEIYSNDLMGLSAVKGFPALLSATLFQLAGCHSWDDGSGETSASAIALCLLPAPVTFAYLCRCSEYTGDCKRKKVVWWY